MRIAILIGLALSRSQPSRRSKALSSRGPRCMGSVGHWAGNRASHFWPTPIVLVTPVVGHLGTGQESGRADLQQ